MQTWPLTYQKGEKVTPTYKTSSPLLYLLMALVEQKARKRIPGKNHIKEKKRDSIALNDLIRK